MGRVVNWTIRRWSLLFISCSLLLADSPSAVTQVWVRCFIRIFWSRACCLLLRSSKLCFPKCNIPLLTYTTSLCIPAFSNFVNCKSTSYLLSRQIFLLSTSVAASLHVGKRTFKEATCWSIQSVWLVYQSPHDCNPAGKREKHWFLRLKYPEVHDRNLSRALFSLRKFEG